MRQKRTVQGSIFDLYAEHEIGRELKAMSDWLDKHPEILDWIAPELCRAEIKETGREGLSVESIVRSAILKQHRQLSYEALAFHLEDSHSFQAFARLPLGLRPKKSVLQKGVSAEWHLLNLPWMSIFPDFLALRLAGSGQQWIGFLPSLYCSRLHSA